MSVRRLRDGFGFACDSIGCDEEWSPPTLGVGSEKPDFNDCWGDAKADGWRARKDARGEWYHICPSCPSK